MAALPQHAAPKGMEPYDLRTENDLGALNDEQQQKLNQFKIKTRLENEKYLRSHPEVECLITGFMREVLMERPENILNFASDHFNKPDLATEIQKQLEDKKEQSQQNEFLRQL